MIYTLTLIIYNDNILIYYIRSAYYNKDYAFRGDIWGRV